jgi:hypothetical protein
VTTVLIFYYSNAQLKTTKICATFSVDVLSGRVNNAVEANSTQGQVKQNLPCFTSEEPENKSSACGGGIFYNDKGIYFYTGRDYIEIRENFKGKLSIPLMGSARNSLFKTLGNPKIKDVSWDAYTTRYGILILYYNKANKVNKIQLSTMTAESINLCQ